MNKPCSNCNNAKDWYLCDFKKECQKFQKYQRFLEKKRKYRPGDQITDLEALMSETFVFWHNRITHISVIKNLQYNVIMRGLEYGAFYRAVKKEREV